MQASDKPVSGVKQRPIVMLANGHSPFDTRIFIKEARSLTAEGMRVAIVVPHDKDEIRNNVSILAVKPFRNGFEKLVISPLRILGRALKQDSSAIYHLHDSDILVVGLVLKLLGRKVIYDAHEDTPLQISYQHWIPSLLRKPYAFAYYLLEKVCGWMFDGIIVAEPVIARYFPRGKTFLVRNFPLAGSFKEHPAAPYLDRKRQVVHVGTLTVVRGLWEMLEAARLAMEDTPFTFVMGGAFSPPSLRQRALEYPVDYRSWLSYPQLLDLLFRSRVGIIIPNPIPRYRTNYPVKMFEFMAAGLPVIASREGEAAAFIREGNCGILVDPLSTNEIADAIRSLFLNEQEAKEMGIRGQALINEKYNWENETKVLIDAYRHFA
jgi:glycosyltransferase involved in cell wall biosynthesis